ncbi:hypothetical protein [Arthrobacter crystallopoietes]|uniref:hypothetical protein n=1 Tax=Crystallibacter crystallopoietes TaxID=37928 RepID=UPI0009428C29|nr:hypothetical protein [Arthrobacter crystallopoietes]AUI53821.1 hypothetical protein AC20117_23080 [Arthrobacter crystallopoietes]
MKSKNRVTGNDSNRLKDQGLRQWKHVTSGADYGPAEPKEAFAASSQQRANETRIRGRAAAESIEGTHPSTAVTTSDGATKAKKTCTGAAMRAERAKGCPTR